MQFRLLSAGKTAFLAFALAFAVVGGMLFFHFYGDWEDADCQAYPMQVVISPGGSRRAEQEQEACASTDKLRTRVLVSGAAGGSAAPVVAYQVETGNALGAMAVGQRSVPLTLRWEGEERLVIVHPLAAPSQLPAGPYGGVDVRLQAALPSK